MIVTQKMVSGLPQFPLVAGQPPYMYSRLWMFVDVRHAPWTRHPQTDLDPEHGHSRFWSLAASEKRVGPICKSKKKIST